MECPICESKKIEQTITFFEKSVSSDSQLIDSKIHNVICEDCGNVFNKNGSRDDVTNFYTNDYQLHTTSPNSEFVYFVDEKNINYSSFRFEILKKVINFKKTGKILDIGCGKGNFLFEFSKRMPDWKIFGVEASKVAIDVARKKIPYARFHQGLFKPGVFDEKFDIIVILGVIEHLEHPVEFLKWVKDFLTDGGIIFFDVPNFKLNPVDLFIFDHLTHFTKETIMNLVHASDLNILQITEFNDKLPLFCFCNNDGKKREIKNYFHLTNSLSKEHVKFNDSMFDSYKQVQNFDQYGVVGLGLMIWVAIQKEILEKEKIFNFYDENEFFINKTKNGICVKNLNELNSLKNLPVIFSVNPCYVNNIKNKINIQNVFFPDEFSYYVKYL